METPEENAPDEGDTVRVTNTESGDVLVEGEVLNVQIYDSDRDDQAEDDDAVYMEIDEEPNGQKLAVKKGVYEGEPYSWARRITDTMGEHNVGNDCWDYEIV